MAGYLKIRFRLCNVFCRFNCNNILFECFFFLMKEKVNKTLLKISRTRHTTFDTTRNTSLQNKSLSGFTFYMISKDNHNYFLFSCSLHLFITPNMPSIFPILFPKGFSMRLTILYLLSATFFHLNIREILAAYGKNIMLIILWFSPSSNNFKS